MAAPRSLRRSPVHRRHAAIAAFTSAAFLFGGSSLASQLGLRVNFTHSAPVGVYRVLPVQHGRELVRGELVELCAPDLPLVRLLQERGFIEAGSCADTHVIPFLKPVRAVAGDMVEIQHGQDATVNGSIVPNTRAQTNLPAWPDGAYIVAPGSIWVFSSYSSGSLDSRYFGPVSLNRVHGTVTTELVFGDVAAMTPSQEQLANRKMRGQG